MIPLKDDNPTYSYPYVTVGLIVINVLIFLFQLLLGPERFAIFVLITGAIPYEIVNLVDIYPKDLVPPPFTLLTAMFVHGGLFHLAGNMLYLWIFGDNIEDRLGHFRFLIFYLFTGVMASLAHILINPASTVPMIGASGAIAGVLGAYFVLFPRAGVITLLWFFFFIEIVRIPAVVFLGMWFAFQLLSSGLGGGIAWYAHIGGFIAGAAVIMIAKPRRRKRSF